MPSLSQPSQSLSLRTDPSRLRSGQALGRSGQGPGEKQGGGTVPVHPMGESGLCAFRAALVMKELSWAIRQKQGRDWGFPPPTDFLLVGASETKGHQLNPLATLHTLPTPFFSLSLSPIPVGQTALHLGSWGFLFPLAGPCWTWGTVADGWQLFLDSQALDQLGEPPPALSGVIASSSILY